MSTEAALEPPLHDRTTDHGSLSSFRGRNAAAMASALTVIGVVSLFSTAIFLYDLWTTDPLKSIGALVPLISLILILRVWRSLGWSMQGTWWGLALVIVTIVAVHIRDHAILELVLTPSLAIFLPPHSLVALAYASGAVLLFGGTRLYRAALFPVVLMWFVNPVPNFFNLWIDLPLQHLSAAIARSFAHAMGQQLTPDQLRLMFTPEFGMFIAPGCNGIRGAITMAFIALIAGYLYRFRATVWAAIVAGAVVLAYIFNLVRLCVLVLFYITALHIPWLQNHAEMGDYLIGACLFFFATVLLFTLIRRFSPNGDLKPPALPAQPTSQQQAPRSFLRRLAAMALVIALGSISYARAVLHDRQHPHAATDEKALGLFPRQVGRFKLQREWNEYLVTGPLIFYWADYVADAPGKLAPGHSGIVADTEEQPATVISVGISPVLGAHDTLLCHSARGEDWLWHGNLDFPTAAGATTFSGSFYNDGARQYLEATTVCTGNSCGQFTSARTHFGFVYSRPDTSTLLSQSPTRPIPILLQTETPDTAMAADAARAELTQNLRDFLQAAQLSEFTQPYRDR